MARPNQNNNRNEQREKEAAERALVVQPPRLPYPAKEAANENITAGQWKALVDAVFPSAKTVDGVMLAINYCKSRGLDVFKKAVHVVPMWNSALNAEVETVWPGINEIRTTASRTGVYAGIDDCVFGPRVTRPYSDKQTRGRSEGKYEASASCPAFDHPLWAQVTVYKIVAGVRSAFVGPKVLFSETFSGEKGLRVPNAKWRASPYQMLEKCAEAAALRRAFPEELANSYVVEEMEGKPIDIASQVRTTGAVDDEVEQVEGEVVNAARPTRESTRAKPWEALGIEEAHWDEIERVQKRIDQTINPDDLRRALPTEMRAFADLGRPDPVLKELELRFNTAIGRLEGTDERQQGLPLEGDAGATTDNGTPANEEDDEQSSD